MKLLERDEALLRLHRVFDRAGEAGGRMVLAYGEAGIGKTSLAHAFAAQIGDRSDVHWGACEDLFTPGPLGPLYDIAYEQQGELLELLRRSAPRPQIFGEFLHCLRHSGRPALVVVEDVHWADEATLDLLVYLGRRIRRTTATALVTFREDEVAGSHPLRKALGQVPPQNVVRLPLAPLSEQAVGELARESGQDLPDLHAITGGNPFFVTELLAGGQEGIPGSIREAVLSRISGLSEPAVGILKAMSIMPGSVESGLLQRIVPHPAETLRECLGASILVARGEGLMFRHELARRAVEQELLPSEAAAYHREALAVLESSSTDVSPARLAHHARGAAQHEKTVRYGHLAAVQSAALGAHRESVRHYAACLEHRGLLDGGQLPELLDGLAYECYLTGDMAAAIEARLELLALYREVQDIPRTGDQQRWLSRLHWFRGKQNEAMRYALQAVETFRAQPESREHAMAISNLAQLHMLHDRNREAVQWGTKALDMAERLADEEIAVHALNNVGAAQSHQGLQEGLEKLRASLDRALASDLQEHAARAFTNLACDHVLLREYGAAVDLLDRGIEYCTERDLDSWILYMQGWRARLNLEQCRWDEAAREAAEVIAREQVASITRILPLLVLGTIRTRRGDSGASKLLDEAWSLAVESGEPERVCAAGLARAEHAFWRHGRSAWREAALPVIRAALGLAAESSDRRYVAELSLWGALAEANLRDMSARATAGEDVATGWPEVVDIPADAWQAAGCRYEAALALSTGEEPEQLRALEWLDEMGANSAANWLRDAMRKQGVAGVPRGPRESTRRNPAGLTNRQLRVLGLLAQGLTNAEIAERLFIAKKTVDHHVSAILEKLGVQSRTEAAARAVAEKLIDPRD